MSLVQPKRIISLSSDFGTKDYRVASMKASICRNNHRIEFIDVSHEIEPFDLVEAAFLVSNAIIHFPPGSIHIVWVFNTSIDEGIILAPFKDQFLIMPNNGLLSLILNEEPAEKIYRVSDDALEYKDRIAFAIHRILEEENIDNMFEEIMNPIRKISVKPVYQKERIQARVLYIDRYGNLIFNIHKEPFLEICQGRIFSFNTQIQQVISNFIMEDTLRENGSFYVGFTDSGFLKLALCGANAAETLDIHKGDTLQIRFE